MFNWEKVHWVTFFNTQTIRINVVPRVGMLPDVPQNFIAFILLIELTIDDESFQRTKFHPPLWVLSYSSFTLSLKLLTSGILRERYKAFLSWSILKQPGCFFQSTHSLPHFVFQLHENCKSHVFLPAVFEISIASVNIQFPITSPHHFVPEW